MALSKEFSSEQLNYFRICHVVATIIPEKLRIVFKHEWDVRYGASHDIWNDTAQNGIDFYSLATPGEKKHKTTELNVIRNGNTMEWDSTCLIYSIRYSNCIGKSLDPTVKKSVDTLRTTRNDYFAHSKDGMIKEADFQSSIQDVITAFKDLKIDTSIIEEIKNQTDFPTKSLRELQNQLDEERRKNKEAQSFRILPPNPSHETIDRVTEVSEIYSEIEILRNNNKEKVTVTYLSGNPGCGKSELARQIGEKYVDEFDADTKCVMTLDASSTDSLLYSYNEFASYLQCSDTSINEIVTLQKSDEDKIIRLQKEFINRGLLRYSSWLMIVDNVEDLKLVSKLIPHAGQTGKGHILITTQDTQSIPPSTSHSNHFSLSEGMQPDDAVNTLSTISKVVDEKHILVRVAKAVGFQPLALACAAMWMQDVVTNDKTAKWTTFLHKLYEGSLEKSERVYKKKCLQYKKTMTEASKMALEVKVAGSEIIKYVFQFLSVIAQERIPMEYIVNYVMIYLPDEDRHSIASEIRSSSLILASEENSISMVRVHQIIHHTLQIIHQNETRDLAFWLNILKVVACLKKQDNNVQPIPLLLVHLSYIICHVTAYFSNHKIYTLKERLYYFVRHFSTKGLTEQYREISTCLLELITDDIYFKKLLRNNIVRAYLHYYVSLPDLLTLVLSMNAVNMSVVLRDRGQCVLAKNLLENASVIAMLPILEALISSYLALVFTQLGHYDHARNFCEKALCISNSKLNGLEYYLCISNIQNSIGVVLMELGEYKQSKKFLCASMKSPNILIALVFRFFQYLGPNGIFGQRYENTVTIHKQTITTLVNVSLTLQELGEYDQALDVLGKALLIMEGKECKDVRSLAVTLRIHALVLQGLGQYHRAKTCLERAIAIQEDEETAYDNNNNPWLARMWRNLASVLQDLGQYLQAKDLLERAQAIEESICHPNLASTLSSLASVLHDLGKYDQAETLLTRAIDIQERTFKEGHPNMAITLRMLASVSQRLGKYENAKSHLEKAMEIQRRTFDYNHPSLAITFTIYASVLRDLGRYEEAKEHLERVITVQEEVLDKEHPSLAYTLCNLASVLQDLGQHEEAICHLERAQSIQEKAFQSDDHPRVATTLSSLASNVQDLGRYTEAKSLLEKALAIQEKAFEKDHPAIANTLQTLAAVLQDLGDYKQARILLERALAIQEKVFDKDHPYLASTLSNLALVSQNLGDNGQAKILLDKILLIEQNTCNGRHPSWANTAINLVLVLKGFGKGLEARSLLKRVTQRGAYSVD